MGKILKNSIEYASTFLGRFKGKIISETPPTDDYDWDTTLGPPATTQYYTGFEIQDSQQNRLSNIDCHAGADGSVSTVIGARQNVNGSNVQNQLYIGVYSDGRRYFYCDDGPAFRYGLGFRDAVTDYGTSGNWTYRKWSSGVSECWGTVTVTLSNPSTPWTGFYGYYTTITFPSGVFNATPIVTYSAKTSESNWVLTGTVTNAMAATGGPVYAITNNGGSKTFTFNIHAIGRWQ